MKDIVYRRKNYFIDIIVLSLILILPFIFFIYLLIPQDLWILRLNGLEVKSNIEHEIYYMFWVINYKLLTISFLMIWFITCKHWWRYSILIPLFIEFHKLFSYINNEVFFINFFGLVNNKTQIISNYNLLFGLFFFCPILIVLMFLSKKTGYYSLKKSLNNELNMEIDDLMLNLSKFKSENYKGFKFKFSNLVENKDDLDKKEYLKQLIQLREEFTSQST